MNDAFPFIWWGEPILFLVDIPKYLFIPDFFWNDRFLFVLNLFSICFVCVYCAKSLELDWIRYLGL